jgi:hypothetical protein
MSPTQKKISDFKPLLTNLAQSSHYEVKFGGLPTALITYLKAKSIDISFIYGDVGLLCDAASLPTSSFASSRSEGNFTGITERFAHTRQYQEISLDFYIDKKYKTLVFLESWMEFISSGSYSITSMNFQNELNYFTRMQYPEDYKTNTTQIVKFDRDYRRQLIYNFVGLFPIALNPIEVGYSESNILKVNATFNYDRYIVGQIDSLSEKSGFSNLLNATNAVIDAVDSTVNTFNSVF